MYTVFNECIHLFRAISFVKNYGDVLFSTKAFIYFAHYLRLVIGNCSAVFEVFLFSY